MSCSVCTQPGTRFCPKCNQKCYCSRACERSDSKLHSKHCIPGSASSRPVLPGPSASSTSSSSRAPAPPSSPVPSTAQVPDVPYGWIHYRAVVRDFDVEDTPFALKDDLSKTYNYLLPFQPCMLASGQTKFLTELITDHTHELLAKKRWKCRCGRFAKSMADAPYNDVDERTDGAGSYLSDLRVERALPSEGGAAAEGACC